MEKARKAAATGAPAFQAAPAYLNDLVRNGDQDRYWSALLATEPARSSLMALYAFHLELARIPEQVTEPQLGAIRLQWWSDALSAALAGEPADHPVLTALAEAARRHDLPRRQLERMIEARGRDLILDQEPITDFTELDRYLAGTAGTVFALGARILGAPEAVEPLADSAARAYGLTGLMRALPVHAAQGLLFLPQSLLAAHGLHGNVVMQGNDNEDLRAVLREMRQRAMDALIEFSAEARALFRPLRPAFLPLALTASYLDRLAAPDIHPLREVVQLNPLKRYALLWRAFLTGRFAR